MRFLAKGPLKDIRWSVYIGGVCPVPVLAYQTGRYGLAMSVLVWRSQCGNAGVFRDQSEIQGKILVSPIGAFKQEKWHLFGPLPRYPKAIKVRGPFSDCPSCNC